MKLVRTEAELNKKRSRLNANSLNLFGGGERDRTDDLLAASQALSQLSYTPTK